MALTLPSTAKNLTHDEQVGRLMQAAIALAGLSVEEVAVAINYTPRQVRYYLSGQTPITWRVINAIASATGQPISAFQIDPKS